MPFMDTTSRGALTSTMAVRMTASIVVMVIAACIRSYLCPGLYYHPGFYGWAYNPWGIPIAFGWGWGGSPWFGYYGGFFQPYPVYPSAAFWLTDYMISSGFAGQSMRPTRRWRSS